MSSDKELEEIRKRRLSELQQRASTEPTQNQEMQKIEEKKQSLLRQILTSTARQRIANIKMIKPEFAAQLELQLIQLAQQGRIVLPMKDKQLKDILRKLQPGRRDINIRRL